MMSIEKNMLDLFRIIATIQVFAGHIVTHYELTNLSDYVYVFQGVPILFILCGFLAARSVEKKNPLDYLKGRAIRIIPAYWVCVLVSSACILILYNVNPSIKEIIVYFITQFFGMNFYTGDWLRDYGVGVPNGVLWTIAVQIQFFLLVPVINKLKYKKYVIGVSTLAFVVCSAFLNRYECTLPTLVAKLINITVLPYMYLFLLGMMAWYLRDKIKYIERFSVFFILLYGIWIIVLRNSNFAKNFDGVLYNVVTTMLLSLIIFSFAFKYNLRLKHDLTYGFYLYHMVVLNVFYEIGVTKITSFWQGLILVVAITVITLVLAMCSNLFVEKRTILLVERKK